MNITKEDQQFVTADEVRQFDARLMRTLEWAELAEMSLSRVMRAHDREELAGFEFPTEAVAAFALLAATLENEAKRMLEWATAMREESTHLWFVRGPAVGRGDCPKEGARNG